MYNIDIICVGKLKEDYLRGRMRRIFKAALGILQAENNGADPRTYPGRPVEGADRLGSRGRGKANFAAHSPVGARLRDVH